jgi:hypothetical protein
VFGVLFRMLLSACFFALSAVTDGGVLEIGVGT